MAEFWSIEIASIWGCVGGCDFVVLDLFYDFYQRLHGQHGLARQR